MNDVYPRCVKIPRGLLAPAWMGWPRDPPAAEKEAVVGNSFPGSYSRVPFCPAPLPPSPAPCLRSAHQTSGDCLLGGPSELVTPTIPSTAGFPMVIRGCTASEAPDPARATAPLHRLRHSRAADPKYVAAEGEKYFFQVRLWSLTRILVRLSSRSLPVSGLVLAGS